MKALFEDLERARVWADLYGTRYEDFIETAFLHYTRPAVKKLRIPLPDKLFSATALAAYDARSIDEFWGKVRISSDEIRSLDRELLPEKYTGSKAQINFMHEFSKK